MVMICLLLAVWPWLNALALLVFQQSMGRAKIRSQHVLRCAIYSGDVILWNGLWGVAAVTAFMYLGRRYDERIVPVLFLGAAFAFLLNFRRLHCAYRYYLKFDRPFATILSSQVIVVLAAFTAFLWAMLS